MSDMNIDFNVSKTMRKIRKDSFEFKNDMDVVVDKLKDLYLNRHLSTNQIPKVLLEETGIEMTSGKCYEIISKLGILRSKSESISLARSTLDYSKTFLTEEMKAIIDGIVIGDGTINANHNTKVARISISGSQQEFIHYCYKLLDVYCPCPPYFTTSDGTKGGVGTWTTSSKFHPDIYKMYERWYGLNGPKDVPEDCSLAPIAVLLWYLGDGSLSSRNYENSLSLYFSTNSFSRHSIENNLCVKLKEMGFETSRITNDNRLFIKTESIVPLLSYMGECPVSCYSYKFNVDEWRLKKPMKKVAEELFIDYQRLAAWVKNGMVRHSRSPGGKKVVFDKNEFEELSNRLCSGELSREKNKKAKTRPSEKNIFVWDSQINRAIGETDEEYLDRMASIYIKNGFPYKRYTDAKLKKDWFSLKKSQYIYPKEEVIKYRRNGLSFADHFHQHIFSLNRKHKISPVDLFNDKALLIECLRRNGALSGTLTYPGLHSAICSDIKSPRLNNFPPLVARDIYNFYCEDGYKILDFCAGFGGRLIGASVSKRNVSYTGIDPSNKTYIGLVNTYDFIKKNKPEFSCNILNGCAEDELTMMRDCCFDFCFTSPPYFDTENYANEGTQSSIRFSDYALWKEKFLRVVVEETYRLLKQNRYFCINIGKFDKFEISNDIEEIAKNVGFSLESKKYIAFPIYGFVDTEKEFRLEPLLVFKKN